MCRVLDGVMLNKDVTNGRMRRVIRCDSSSAVYGCRFLSFSLRNPRIVLLDCTLEYKKGSFQSIAFSEEVTSLSGESETSVEVTKEADWAALLRQEEEEVQKVIRIL